MPMNGSGVFERTPGTRIANQGALVSAQVNDETDNLIDGINAKLSLSGQLPMTGALAMGGFKITGGAAGVAGTDFAIVSQLASNLSSTTEVLTGTDTAKSTTPNAIAALWEAGADITDGATITIGEGGYFNLITSTSAITAFTITTNKAGRSFRVRFNTVRTLTHNATSLILPGAANITTAVGDIAFIRSLGSGNVVVEAYTSAAVAPGGGGGTTVIRRQVFTASGTYTPHASMLYCDVIATGGGGGGGGADTTTTTDDIGVGGGGGAGGTVKKIISKATIGASQTVTIGAAGAASNNTGGNGGNGGNTTLGALLTANGGTGGTGAGSSSTASDLTLGGAGGAASSGDTNLVGGKGYVGFAHTETLHMGLGGKGGASFWGEGGEGGSLESTNIAVDGLAGPVYGSGGGGAVLNETTSTCVSGAGAAGYIEITEYCSA